ncbi:MAG TPA: carboxymuconolactone decarboxylase family protein [Pseudomonadales bacterium]|nr:carboxymuconolactone decarboxylase family protein [Pseudomonadales bacterium]
MPRLTRRTRAEMTDEQRDVFDRIAEGRKGVEDGHIGGPFDAWVLNPEMGRRITGLGGVFRFRTLVDRRQIELAILMVGAHWRAQFEWYAHAPMAAQAGLPDEVIEAIKVGAAPEFTDDADKVAYALVKELLESRRVSDDTFNTAVQKFGEQGVSELVNVSGYYVMVSMTLNTFEVPLPDGAETPFQ